MVTLTENCEKIRYLCLSGCSRLTDASLMALSQYCTQLETLEVAACSLFTDTGFQALAKVRLYYFILHLFYIK